MHLKQKLSLFSGLLLPSLALSAYFLVAPARSTATGNCEPPQCDAPCGFGGCENGSGSCFANGSHSYGYVYCKTSPEGGYGGPGRCNDGCVTCDYGGYCG